METALIREIQPNDHVVVAVVIRKVLIDLGVRKIGTAYADKALDQMFENYDVAKAGYFVLEDQGRIITCTGIAQFGFRNSFEYAFKGN
jgi:putative acetyltransferase